MPYNEVVQLRKSGNLEEAYEMALTDLKSAQSSEHFDVAPTNTIIDELLDENLESESPVNIAKRAVAWVLYDYLRRNTDKENIDTFIHYLHEFNSLDLDKDEKMVVNQLVWLIGKLVFGFTIKPGFEIAKIEKLAKLTMELNFSKQKGILFYLKDFTKHSKDRLYILILYCGGI